MSELSDDRDYWHKNTARLEQENDNLQKEVQRLKNELQWQFDRDWTASVIDRLNELAREQPKFFSEINTGPEASKMIQEIHGLFNSHYFALSAAQKRIEELEQRDALHREYECLLVEELGELIGIAWTHGWRSTRYEQGKLLRQKLGIAESTTP